MYVRSSFIFLNINSYILYQGVNYEFLIFRHFGTFFQKLKN